MHEARWSRGLKRLRRVSVCWCAAAIVAVQSVLTIAAPAASLPQDEPTAAPAPPQPAPPVPDAKPAEQPDVSGDSLRIVEHKGKSIALEIAARDYARPDGTGPKVGLIGVAHIGERSFYRSVQKLLEEYDIVLYESVKPPGTGGARGETDEDRIQSTKAAMEFVGGMIEAHRVSEATYPPTLSALEAFAAEQDPRLGQWLSQAMIDAWGRPLLYELTGEGDKYELRSLGADGREGGEGADADLRAADNPPDPLSLAKEDQLQSQLADALRLEFQLDALDYSRPNWRCSDMAMDELSRRLQARGLDFAPLGGTLAGTSFSGKVISFFLSLIRVADSFFGGAIVDAMKVVMIDMLGQEAMLEAGLSQLGEGFSEVIIDERNQVAVDDLKAIIEREPDVKSVAILYGAAHMPDMAQRLQAQLGYAPVGERWLAALKVDLARSALPPAQLEKLRRDVRMMMRQQMRNQ